MTPVFQTRFGKDGNCWPACLATILDVPLESVDHCSCQYSDWNERTNLWLKERGLFNIEVNFKSSDGIHPFVAPPDGTLCLLIGPAIRGLNHVVVARVRLEPIEGNPDKANLEFDLVHDPYPGAQQPNLQSISHISFIGKIL